VKITDFGLWFKGEDDEGRFFWSSTIPQARVFYIFYDGIPIGGLRDHGYLLMPYYHKPYKIKIITDCPLLIDFYEIGRPLTLEDFEIIPNPDYKSDV
jgi:hypothetical protein